MLLETGSAFSEKCNCFLETLSSSNCVCPCKRRLSYILPFFWLSLFCFRNFCFPPLIIHGDGDFEHSSSKIENLDGDLKALMTPRAAKTDSLRLTKSYWTTRHHFGEIRTNGQRLSTRLRSFYVVTMGSVSSSVHTRRFLQACYYVRP